MKKNNCQLIIGLGNPGKEYEKNRHNAGFIILDALQKRPGFSDFKFEKKFNAEISEKNGNGNNEGFFKKLFKKDSAYKILLIKPMSFMNKSGEVVKKITYFYKIPVENITVIHDDLDLLIGNLKISQNSGSAGHNGVKNIIDKLGTREFKRIRIGVEKKEGRQSRQIPGDKFVLQNFSEEEFQEIKKMADKLEDLVKCSLE